MLLEISVSTRFKKDLRRIEKRGYNMDLMNEVIETLRAQKPLDKKYDDHNLHGRYKDFRECHIQEDWLLVYRISDGTLTLFLSRTGSHADIYG